MAPVSIYVGGLCNDIQKEDLEREFSCFGNLTKVWVACNPPGFAFIEFQNNNDANKAIKEMNGAIINRSKIRVALSHSGSKRGKGLSGTGDGFCRDYCISKGFREGQNHRFGNDFRHREKDFLQGCPRYQSGGYYGSTGYHSWSSISQSSDIAWKPVGVIDRPVLVKTYKDSSEYENSSKKRKITSAKNFFRGSVKKRKAYVKKLNDTLNINCLPEEILVNIFCYLRMNELARIARVCKWWYQISSYPVLWKKMNVLVQKSQTQNKVASSLSKNLPACVTHLKLDFESIFWKEFASDEPFEFDTFCMKLGKRCPSLKAFVLHYARFTISFQSVINLCIQYMPNLEILSICFCHFTGYSLRVEYGDQCKIKVLDLHFNSGNNFNKHFLSEIVRLRTLNIPGYGDPDSLFEDNTSLLDNLDMLSIRHSQINSSTFQRIKNHALKLTELYLCGTQVEDTDFRFNKSMFPQLKTICLKHCFKVTCEALISLVRSCQSLQNIYVDHVMAASYAEHPFFIANKCKLHIVKSTYLGCPHIRKDYLYEE